MGRRPATLTGHKTSKTSGLRPEPRPSSEIPPQITSPGTTRATSLPGRGQGRSAGEALHLVPVRGGWTVYRLPDEEIRLRGLPRSCRRLAVANRSCQASAVEPMELLELSPDNYYLTLDAGTTDVDDVVEELGHEPNGYFWEGIAQLIVASEASALAGRFSYDPEGGMFCAYGSDRGALEELATRMTAVATDAERVRRLVALAEATGFEFDD